jgi:hypothetical protein
VNGKAITPFLHIPFDLPEYPTNSFQGQGFGISVHTREESELVAEMQMAGKQHNEIMAALDDLRRNRGTSGAGNPGDARDWPGVAYEGDAIGGMRAIDGKKWLRGTDGNAGFVPGQIADQLAGRKFANFDAFREAF